MNLAIKEPVFDVAAARKALARAIEIKRATERDIDTVTIIIRESETRIEKMREGLHEFSDLTTQLAQAASDALKSDAPLVTPPNLAEAKARHAKLVDDIEFAEAGLASLRAKREQYVRDLAIHTTRVSEAATPIVNDVGEFLAEDCLAREHEAALVREKVRAYVNSSANQQLGPLVYRVMNNLPENAGAPKRNTKNWHRCQQWKFDFALWRKELEANANAELKLNT